MTKVQLVRNPLSWGSGHLVFVSHERPEAMEEATVMVGLKGENSSGT